MHWLTWPVDGKISHVSDQGLSTDPAKVETLRSLPKSTIVTKVRGFLGMASFYRRLIRNLSLIAAEMSNCLKKGPFRWSAEARKSFERLKMKLTTT